MMNLQQALAYGKQIGVKYFVKSTRGTLYGASKTREQAEEIKKEMEKEYKDNPFIDGELVFVIEDAKWE